MPNAFVHRLLFATICVALLICNAAARISAADAPSQNRALNLAAGKPAQASSEQGQNKAACAVDGQAKTRWCAADSGPNHWWQVDLGQSEVLTGCRLDWESRSAVYRYSIEGSADAKSWKLLADGSQNTQGGAVVCSFKSDSVRYVRITFLGSNSGSWGSLWEVQVFGQKTVAVTPEMEAREAQDSILAEVKVPAGSPGQCLRRAADGELSGVRRRGAGRRGVCFVRQERVARARAESRRGAAGARFRRRRPGR